MRLSEGMLDVTARHVTLLPTDGHAVCETGIGSIFAEGLPAAKLSNSSYCTTALRLSIMPAGCPHYGWEELESCSPTSASLKTMCCSMVHWLV